MCVTRVANGKGTHEFSFREILLNTGCESWYETVPPISKGMSSLVQNLRESKSIGSETQKGLRYTLGGL